MDGFLWHGCPFFYPLVLKGSFVMEDYVVVCASKPDGMTVDVLVKEDEYSGKPEDHVSSEYVNVMEMGKVTIDFSNCEVAAATNYVND